MTDPDAAPGRWYLSSRYEKARLRVRQNLGKAAVSGVSVAGILAGFMSASGTVWPLLAYIAVIATVGAAALFVLSLPSSPAEYLMLWIRREHHVQPPGRPRQLELVRPVAKRSGARLVLANRCDDPVYGAGLRALLGDSRPVIIMPSNPRDVAKPHELLYPMYVGGHSRSRVELDVRPAGIPLPVMVFERELPEGAQDPDHTLAIRDLVFVPELVLALREAGACLGTPVTWPEHCIDPMVIASHDVIVIGGPDTNFWHAALYEAVSRQFDVPGSSIPLAMGLRELRNGFPVYGSRSMLVSLHNPAGLPKPEGGVLEMDERLFPTFGMILACRNPFAAAVGVSRWCVFVAGTRSLGTSGAVLGLAAILRQLRADPGLNFSSTARTARDGVHARVAAVLTRTTQVERAIVRRDGQILDRGRHELAPVGLDPGYSDTYLPTGIEYLEYDGLRSAWQPLCAIPET